jgi:addiction module HigA family antidote
MTRKTTRQTTTPTTDPRMAAPPHPGLFLITEVLEPHGLTVAAAARALGVSRVALSTLLHGHAALSADMALRVEKAFGVPLETLMQLQTAFDIARTRERAHTISVPRYRPARKPGKVA